MNNAIKNIIIVINYTFLTVAMLASALFNIENSMGIIFLYLLALFSYSGRTYFVYNNYENEKGIKYRKKQTLIISACITYLLEIFIVISLQSYDTHLISLVILALILEDLVVNTNLRLALGSALGIYLISCSIFYFEFINNSSSMIISMLLILPIYVVIFIIFYLINFLLRQNEIIEASLRSITIKNIEKDNLYKNLKEAYGKVEIITALRERNKISATIHDTVGHTLTTVLVELEAAKRLMNKDIDKSKEKLNLAQGQVRKGLNDIRSSVRVLEKGEEILGFFKSLEVLLNNTERDSEVVIKRDMDETLNIPKEQEEVIFSALMEGLSNGIRHGKSTTFFFKLGADMDKVRFSLADNGRGASVIAPGFGLRAMRARVQEFNGELKLESNTGEGFSLEITFPLIRNIKAHNQNEVQNG